MVSSRGGSRGLKDTLSSEIVTPSSFPLGHALIDDWCNACNMAQEGRRGAVRAENEVIDKVKLELM